MSYTGTFSSWTRSFLLAGSLALGCGNETTLYPVEQCTSDYCEKKEIPEPQEKKPEKVCPNGNEGDSFWLLPNGTLGDMAEKCNEEQICLGGLCAKLGTFTFVSNRDGETEIYTQERVAAPIKITTSQPNESPLSPYWCGSEILLFELMKGDSSEISRLDSNGHPQSISHSSRYNNHPSCDAAGEIAYFSSDRTGSWNIYKVGMYGGALSRLTHGPDSHLPETLLAAFNPDICKTGDWVVFRCDYRVDETHEVSEICKIHSDGTGLVRLTYTEHGSNDAPACSPNGREVAFTSLRYDAELGHSNEDVYVMDIDGNNERRITSDQESESTPAFSPDGKLIGYEKIIWIGEGRYVKDLWVTDRDGLEYLQLTNDAGKEYSINWKP